MPHANGSIGRLTERHRAAQNFGRRIYRGQEESCQESREESRQGTVKKAAKKTAEEARNEKRLQVLG